MGDYPAEFVCRQYFGFGQPADFEPIYISGGFLKTMWAPTPLHLADVLDVEVQDWNIVYETDSVDHDVETGFGTVAAGTTSVVHFELQALNGGRPIAIVEHADRVAHDAGPQWPAPYGPRGDVLPHRGRGHPALHVGAQLLQPQWLPIDDRDASDQRHPRGALPSRGSRSARDSPLLRPQRSRLISGRRDRASRRARDRRTGRTPSLTGRGTRHTRACRRGRRLG